MFNLMGVIYNWLGGHFGVHKGLCWKKEGSCDWLAMVMLGSPRIARNTRKLVASSYEQELRKHVLTVQLAGQNP